MNSFEILKLYVANFVSLEEYQWDCFAKIFHEKKLRAREVHHPIGQVYSDWTFIVSGALRFHRIVNDKDSTFNLFSQRRFLTDTVSLFEKRPSEYDLSAVIDTTILVTSNKEWEALMNSDPVFDKFGRMQYEYFLRQAMLRMQRTLLFSPKEQYKMLSEEEPDLLEMIPLKYIASFLNITPQSLSRIKRRMKKEKHVK